MFFFGLFELGREILDIAGLVYDDVGYYLFIISLIRVLLTIGSRVCLEVFTSSTF